ncbi:hypothetical protein LCER1_G008284 [Lachnellula cervina]|uniref:Fungal N-terminal domain-containing protein n=1 Tax=Lachnellula cervina TaxID=1316786 RepID=A0A7D8YSN2_9HELO|nr:hypothetical protein LCER1_G008284 [Lachnellula cervina]
MSFGYSVGDFMLLTQLAYRVVHNARKACGAHNDLAREIGSLYIVLGRVEVEVCKPDSILNNNEDNRRSELERLARHCKRVLRVLEQILDKYNALSEEKRSVTKLWQKVKFGNGEMLDLGKIRAELATHTQALNLFLNLLSIGSQGKMEKYMDSHGEELRDIKHSLHWVTSSMQAKSHEEKSILTTYGDDDKAIWKAFRRELIEEGFSGRLLDRHKSIIKDYVMELGARGALDEPIQQTLEEDIQTQSMPPPERPDSPVFLDSSSDSDELTESETEDERTVQDSLTNLEGLSNPTAITSSQQMEENYSSVSSKNEPDRGGDQGRFTPLKPPTNTFAGTAMQNKSTNHFDTTSDKDDLSFARMPIQKMKDCNPPQQTGSPSYEAHGELEAYPSETPQPSTGKSRSTLQTSVEEVEDDDFQDGAHPNCESSYQETSTVEASDVGSKTKLPRNRNLDTLDHPPPRTSHEDAADVAEAEPVERPRSTTYRDTKESENKGSSTRAAEAHESTIGEHRGVHGVDIQPREGLILKTPPTSKYVDPHLVDPDGTIRLTNHNLRYVEGPSDYSKTSTQLATWRTASEKTPAEFLHAFPPKPLRYLSSREERFWYALDQFQLNMSRLENMFDDLDVPRNPPSITFFNTANELVKIIRWTVENHSTRTVATRYIDRVLELNLIFLDYHNSPIRRAYAREGITEDSLSWREESWWRKESDPSLDSLISQRLLSPHRVDWD